MVMSGNRASCSLYVTAYRAHPLDTEKREKEEEQLTLIAKRNNMNSFIPGLTGRDWKDAAGVGVRERGSR